jgi:hypothetical protein
MKREKRPPIRSSLKTFFYPCARNEKGRKEESWKKGREFILENLL